MLCFLTLSMWNLSFLTRDQTHTACTSRWSLLTTGLPQKSCELLFIFNAVVIWFCCHLLLQFYKSSTINVLKTLLRDRSENFCNKGHGPDNKYFRLCKSAATIQLWNYSTKTAIDKICKLVKCGCVPMTFRSQNTGVGQLGKPCPPVSQVFHKNFDLPVPDSHFKNYWVGQKICSNCSMRYYFMFKTFHSDFRPEKSVQNQNFIFWTCGFKTFKS